MAAVIFHGEVGFPSDNVGNGRFFAVHVPFAFDLVGGNRAASQKTVWKREGIVHNTHSLCVIMMTKAYPFLPPYWLNHASILCQPSFADSA